MKRFKNKVVLVTGAASGMGRSSCLRLASEGALIYGIDLDDAGLAATAERVRSAGGTMEVAVRDVTSKDQCVSAVNEAVETYGHLDVLANVAGVCRFGHAHAVTEEEWNFVLAVNLSGPFFLSQAAIPALIESKGNIVNVASVFGVTGQAYSAAYCASKGGLIQLTKSMAVEYAKESVRINAICPGSTNTEMMAGIDFSEDMDWNLIERATKAAVGEPEDIASAIAYLASDEAKMVNGSIFVVDNGLLAG
ncbi:MAG: SDR family oxidoreductase [Proteobacteria bacterium]|nr:SDR family oxidoreductase [Pseudomonadota bacterium]